MGVIRLRQNVLSESTGGFIGTFGDPEGGANYRYRPGRLLTQYDDETRTVGSNTRLRWTFNQLGELFLVYNHNVRENLGDRWIRESNQLITKVQYTFRM